MTGFSLRFDSWFQQGDADVAGIGIYLSGAKFARGVVQFSWEARTIALAAPWAQKDQSKAESQVREAVLRLGVQRLAAIVREKEIAKADVIEVPIFMVDVPAVTKLAQEKTCSYQLWQGPDLFCTAASHTDEAARGSIGLRSVAPTSRPVCKACNLPDTDYICSHLSHPQIGGLWTVALYERGITFPPLCNLGRPEIENAAACRAGGNSCWEYGILPDAVVTPALITPRSLADAFDHLDAIWRLAFKNPLLHIKRAADVLGLALPCSTGDEFKSRLSDVTDVLSRLHVDNALLPGTVSRGLANIIGAIQGTPLVDIPKGESFNRLAAVVDLKLQDTAKGQGLAAIKTLRLVRDLRVAAQHADAAERLPGALGKLGLPFPITDYGETWDQVRSKTVDALAALRQAIDTLI